MSYFKLFRKEALRQQYKSQEFGESVIEQPAILNKALLSLVIALVLFVLLAASFPFISTQRYNVEVHDSNYLPLVSPVPVVVEKHLQADASLINTNQPVSQIRLFQNDSRIEVMDVIRSVDSGYFFSLVAEGSTVPAFQPIAKVLRKNDEHIYFFWLTDAGGNNITPGKTVKLQSGSFKVQGYIQSVAGPYLENRLNVGIRLVSPFEAAILNPTAATHLELSVKRNNFFDLLGGT